MDSVLLFFFIVSFLFMPEQSSISVCVCKQNVCVCVCVHHIFFIHLSADGHLGWFHVLAIVNIAAMNIGVQVSF